MEKYIEDFMIRPGGSHKVGENRLVHGKRIWKKHPLFDKFYPYRCRKGDSASRYIIVTKAVYNWIIAGNSLSKNECIIHLDGDRLNDDIENLEALSKKENLALNGFIATRRGLPVQFIKTYIKILKVRYRIGELNDKKES